VQNACSLKKEVTVGDAQHIKPAARTRDITYAVRDIVVLAQEVAAGGKEMLYLNIGDPNQFDFRTPEHIVEAAHQAMKHNDNGYSPSSGIPAAREAIEVRARQKGIENILDIFVTSGVSEAIDVCFSALVDAGENILIPTPSYPLYSAVLNKLGARPNAYFLDEDNGWQPDVDDIRKKIDGRTRGIVVINPNNPTGSVCTEETLRQIISLAREHDLVIFADEIYDQLILEPKEHRSLAALDADLPMITFNGLSKAYLVPGWRIGWGVASGGSRIMGAYLEAINKLLRARLCANHPEQYAIAPALQGDQNHLQEMKARLIRRRDLTVKMLNDIEGISCVKPEGAFYAFPRLEIEGSDWDFVRALIRETGVVVVPGGGFGQRPGSQHFRVVFLPPEEILERAYDQIGRFMKAYQAG
jgi:alanine-synthesizing transaminase